MKFQSIKLLFILSCLYHQYPKRVFIFDNKNNSNDAELSSATLTNKPLDNLPEHFIICSTHNQEKFHTPDTHTLYVIYWDENFQIPWFSIGFWGHAGLWANVNNTYWYDISTLPTELLDDWITVCLEIDSVKRTISTSIGGDTFHKILNVKGLEERPKLNLQLGIVDHSYDRLHKLQFHGKVADISLFNSKDINITEISYNLCNFSTEKTIQRWENMSWNIVGKSVVETYISNSLICPDSNFINVRIPLKWTKASGEAVCDKMGKMFEFEDLEDIEDMNMEHTFGEKYSECDFFWTPYMYIDGKVVNQYDGKIIRFVCYF